MTEAYELVFRPIEGKPLLLRRIDKKSYKGCWPPPDYSETIDGAVSRLLRYLRDEELFAQARLDEVRSLILRVKLWKPPSDIEPENSSELLAP